MNKATIKGTTAQMINEIYAADPAQAGDDALRISVAAESHHDGSTTYTFADGSRAWIQA